MAKTTVGIEKLKVTEYDIINSVCGIIHVGLLKINGLFKQEHLAMYFFLKLL